MERTVFYYHHNKLLLKYSPILLFVLCLFWSLIDLATGDSMFFVKTGAMYGIALMAVTAGVSFFEFVNTDKVFTNKTTDKAVIEKRLNRCIVSFLAFFIAIIIGSALVCGANNYAVSLSGAAATNQTISLSSTLLFIPVLIPFPNKKFRIAIIASIFVSLAIPCLMPGKECYSILPEFVLRVAISIAFIVVSRSIEDGYLLDEKIKNGNTKILAMLVNLIELRDLESGRHVNKVSEYTKIMLEKLQEEYPEYGLTSDEIQTIADASLMHDVGKILIPDKILLKPGGLTEEEFEIMKTHTIKGTEIMQSLPDEIIASDFLRYSLDICKYHHEKYDGKGYPFGISGEDIPIWAQVVSIIDCYEALTSERHYKEAFSHDTAVRMIINGECGAFSEKVMKCFIDCNQRFPISG